MSDMIKKEHPGKSLGQSLDILRKDVSEIAADIDELYGLDDDNFNAIQDLRKAVQNCNKRFSVLDRQAKVRQSRRILGWGLLGAGMYCVFKSIREVISELNTRVEALENNKERDG